MEKKQWVQHTSGQGEKWEVSGKLYNQEDNNDWQVIAKNDPSPFNYHYLPKSEYRLCEPPEVWRDVTGDVDIRGGMNKSGAPVPNEFVYHKTAHLANLVCGGAYRLRKVQLFGPSANGGEVQWAFIVEQKVS